jgi:hypothetical protein
VNFVDTEQTSMGFICGGQRDPERRDGVARQNAMSTHLDAPGRPWTRWVWWPALGPATRWHLAPNVAFAVRGLRWLPEPIGQPKLERSGNVRLTCCAQRAFVSVRSRTDHMMRDLPDGYKESKKRKPRRIH